MNEFEFELEVKCSWKGVDLNCGGCVAGKVREVAGKVEEKVLQKSNKVNKVKNKEKK